MSPVKVTVTNENQINDLIDESGYDEVDYDYWRHGHAVQYHVVYDGKDYLTDFIRVHPEEGRIWEGSVDLWPAHQVMKQVWVRS